MAAKNQSETLSSAQAIPETRQQSPRPRKTGVAAVKQPLVPVEKQARRVVSIKSVSEKPWRSLAAFAVSVDAFCKEVLASCKKWSAGKVVPQNDLGECAGEMQQLATWGESVLEKYHMEMPFDMFTPPDQNDASALSIACERLKSIGVEPMLTCMIAILRRIERRLREPYSLETVKRINEDFQILNRLVVAMQRLVKRKRNLIQRYLASSSLPANVEDRVNCLFIQVECAILDAPSAIEETASKQKTLESMLQGRLDSARDIKAIYMKLRSELTSLKKLLAINADATAENYTPEPFDPPLESLGSAIAFISGILEGAMAAWQAACMGVDHELKEKADELLSEINLMRIEFKELDQSVWECRDIVTKAPFRHFKRTVPLPPWSRLRKYHPLLRAFVQWRQSSADGQEFTTTRKQIDKKLGKPTNDSTANRSLQHLQEEYQILGRYQQIPNNENPQTSYAYWINEDAYREYLPHARGRSRKSKD